MITPDQVRAMLAPEVARIETVIDKLICVGCDTSAGIRVPDSLFGDSKILRNVVWHHYNSAGWLVVQDGDYWVFGI